MQRHNQLSLGWVLPRPFAGSGGLNNIFRMIGALQNWGHSSVIYCGDSEGTFGSQAALTTFIRSNWGLDGVECVFATAAPLKPHDILLATHWSTVSKVRSDTRAVRKGYFVQDFEPLFFPMGDEYVMAENTYASGLSCITLGHWLESLLRENYALDTCGFDFPVDTTIYRPGDGGDARPFDIVYYGQPDKPRRAFQLGCEALRLVRQARPQTTIAMFGSQVLAKVQAPVPFRNFGLQTPSELARLYKQSKIGLVLSTSNPSLIPCEMMACGAAVVDLLRGNNLHDYQPGSIRLSQQNPESMAADLLALLEQQEERQQQVDTATAMVAQRSYEASARTVEAALLRLHLTGRVSPAESPCLDIRQDFANQQCQLPLEGSGELRSSFVCRMPNLTRIDLTLVQQSESVDGKLILNLREAGRAQIIHRVVRPFEAVPANGFVEFNFPAIPDSAHKTFIVTVAFCPKSSTEQNPGVLYADSTDLGCQGALFLDEKPVEGTLRFRTFCRPQLRPPSPLHAAIFEQALQMRGQTMALTKDPTSSGLAGVYRHLSLIERRPAAVSASEATRKAKLRAFLKLLRADGRDCKELTVEGLIGDCRDLFQEELDQAGREEQANSLFEQARAAEASGRLLEMESPLVQALQKVPGHEDALLLYGRWLLRQKRVRDGFEQLQRLLTLNPRCTAAYNEVGRAMYQAGMVREAHGLFVRAVRCQPQDREGWINLVELHHNQGTRSEGANILAQWLKLAPSDAEALRWKERYDGASGASMPKLVEKESPRNAGVAHPISVATLLAEPEEFACPYLRVTSVLKHLEQEGFTTHLRASVTKDGQIRILTEQLRSADVVLVQRQMAGIVPYAALIQQLGGRTPKIVFDLDDALTLLPQSHRAYEPYRRLAPHIEEYARHADLVTVSTPELAALYRSFNENIVVLPNSIDATLWNQQAASPEPSGRIRILFSGTLDHERDLQVVEDALLDLIDAYPETVEFLYWGNVTERLRSRPQVISIHEFKPNYLEYAALLRTVGVSFAIVPLEDTPFNRAKSPIKWLEYSACRIPGIFSDLCTYNQSVEHGRTGLLVPNTRETWFAAMKSLVENHPLRQQLAAQAHQTVMAGYTVDRNSRQWLQAYESLFGNRGAASFVDNAPRTSIVIPVLNNIGLTRQCLKAIRQNTPGGNYEIIVVDNGSNDETAEFLKAEESTGALRLVRNNANLGFACACNQGAASARGKYLLFLNNDTEVCPDWLEPLCRTAENDSSIGAVGSKLLFPDRTIQHGGVVLVDDRRLNDPLLARHAYYQAPQEIPEANRPMIYQALTAACLLVPREFFATLGGFDEQFWNGYEDIDLCFRLAQAGRLAVYQPASVVIHHESQSGSERFRKAPQNIARLHQKWLGRIHADFVAGADGEMTKTKTIRIREYTGPARESVAAPCAASIIIPALNQVADTRRCLESIVARTRLPHEVIIVDNGSTDGTAAFLKDWLANHSNCRVIRNSTNRGFAAANNQAFAIATGEHLVLLNNDTVVTEGWLEGMLRVSEEHPGTGVVGPMSNNVSGPQFAGKVDYRDLAGLPDFVSRWSEKHQGQSIETPRAVGFCLLVRRAVLDRIGGLDESFGSGNFEDDDFCIRARIAGFRIRIAQDVFIHHAGSQTFKGERIDYRQAMLRNWEIFRNKWKLPSQTTLETGYPVPTQLPDGVSLRVEITPLSSSHEADGKGYWRQKGRRPQRPVPAIRPAPAVARVGILEPARAMYERKELSSAWKSAVEALAQRPFHPEAYLLLAEIAQAAGDSKTARQCAQYARELAPDWKGPKQFLQKALKGKSSPDWIDLPESLKAPASQNAQRLARITVCIIARNEEKFLTECLQSVKSIAHQIVVVDTGSTDRTTEIAKSFGAEIYHFDWCDDFSAARNVSLEHARGDWVLILDADEELPADQHARLRADLKNRKSIAFRLPLVNLGQEAEGRSCVPRLFRNAPGVYFAGRIHEQVFNSLILLGKPWGLGTGLGTAQLLHRGYSKQNMQDRNKVERNLNLLQLAVEESPDDANLAMNLGLELVRSGDLDHGLTHYRTAFDLVARKSVDETAPELREALLTQFTSHLYKIRAHAEVVDVLTSPMARNGGLTASLDFALGLACFELGRYPQAVEQMRQCLAKRRQPALTPINTDILTAAPYHCLGMSLARAGDLEGAEKAFQSGMAEKGRTEELRLDYAKFLREQNRPVDALHRLHELVTENPRSAAAWRLGAQIAMSHPDFLEFANDWTTEAIKQHPEDTEIVSQRAEALLLSQQTAQARELWQTLWEQDKQPRSLAALLICEILEDSPMTNSSAHEADLGPTSRAFIDWYRRCLAMRAQPVVAGLNERMEHLRGILPAAAGMLEAALTEAREASPIAPEPCLA